MKKDWTQNQSSFQVPLKRDLADDGIDEIGKDQGSTAGNSSQPTN